ncbi:MAG TPA: hypothetical protein VNT27_06295, partial [Propionibacteriaceae bacterium]|nr:hypothetical protein [Propionibacteriaceae bacterium]
DPYQVEECMQRQLRKHHAELHARAAARQSIADSAPALGIVAAVLVGRGRQKIPFGWAPSAPAGYYRWLERGYQLSAPHH